IGKPAVAAVWESSPDRYRRLAASLAAGSNHPVSQAITSVSTERLPLEHWEELRGAGVKASLGSQPRGGEAMMMEANGEVFLGSLPWLGSLGVDCRPAKAFVEQWTGEAASLVGLASGKKCLALFALSDALKP